MLISVIAPLYNEGPGDDSDNSTYVVMGVGDAIIDGFTVTGGNGSSEGKVDLDTDNSSQVTESKQQLRPQFPSWLDNNRPWSNRSTSQTRSKLKG